MRTSETEVAQGFLGRRSAAREGGNPALAALKGCATTVDDMCLTITFP